MRSTQSEDYEKRLQAALQELSLKPTLSIRKVAGNFGVPKSTLADRKTIGCQNAKLAHHHETILSSTQEQALVDWAIFQDDLGVPICKTLLKDKAEAILQVTAPEKRLGVHWVDRFIKRYPEIEMRYSQRLEHQRSLANNPKVLEHHFKVFDRAVKKYQIKNETIWNIDEKGFQVGISTRIKVICRAGKRNPRYTDDGNRENVTVLEVISAVGKLLPPLIITKGAHHYAGNHIRGHGPPGYVYGHSEKG